MTLQTASIAAPSASAGTGARLLPSIMAALLGLFIVGMVGFSPIDLIHNAAHDARHANAFPCH